MPSLDLERADDLYTHLAPAQTAMRQRGIRCLRVLVVSINLSGLRTPAGYPEFHAPALEVWDPQGCMVATVTIGKRSQVYEVSIPTAQAEPHTVPIETPEAIVPLIPGYGPRKESL